MKRSLCFDLKHCMYPASMYLLLKGKARVVCGVWPPVNLLPTSSFVVDGKAAASPFPRDMWCTATEGEWDSHHPAALQEADAGVCGGGGRYKWEGGIFGMYLSWLAGIAPRCFVLGTAPRLGLSFPAAPQDMPNQAGTITE